MNILSQTERRNVLDFADNSGQLDSVYQDLSDKPAMDNHYPPCSIAKQGDNVHTRIKSHNRGLSLCHALPRLSLRKHR